MICNVLKNILVRNSDNNDDDDNDCVTGLCSEFVIFIWFYEIQYSLFMVINTNQVISLCIIWRRVFYKRKRTLHVGSKI